jgi:hypothetical protein
LGIPRTDQERQQGAAARIGFDPFAKLGQFSAEVLEIEVTFLIAQDLETTRIHSVAILDLAGALAIVGIVGSQKRLLNEPSATDLQQRSGECPQMLDFGGQVIPEIVRGRWTCRSAQRAHRLEKKNRGD